MLLHILVVFMLFIWYLDEEYEDCIFDVPPNWTKALTDELFELCRKYGYIMSNNIGMIYDGQ